MDGGYVIEAGDPSQIFDQPQQARTLEFVGTILRHWGAGQTFTLRSR
jgi:polar amino acid transport system ATP-binding protein